MDKQATRKIKIAVEFKSSRDAMSAFRALEIDDWTETDSARMFGATVTPEQEQELLKRKSVTYLSEVDSLI